MTEYSPQVPSPHLTEKLIGSETGPIGLQLFATLQALERFGNHGLVSLEDDGKYSFLSLPEAIAAKMGGPEPQKSDFTFSDKDTLIFPDGTRMPFSDELLMKAATQGIPKIEIQRPGNGATHYFEIVLSPYAGSSMFLAQINDVSERYLAERLSKTIERYDLQKKAKIIIDSALDLEMAAKKPEQTHFLQSVAMQLKVLFGESVDIGIYSSTPAEGDNVAIVPLTSSSESSPPLSIDIAAQAQQISRNQFEAVTGSLDTNSAGYDTVTAVASFTEGNSDMQKILSVYSKGKLHEDITKQLPYIMQDIKFALRKLRETISIHNKLTKTERELQEARMEARVDKLTSLPNRRWLVEHVLNELSTIERNIEKKSRGEKYTGPVEIGLVFADIDLFKKFNSAYGHNAGDIVLSEVASELGDNKRSEDFAARFGGEEFLITVPGQDIRGTVAAAERHRQAIERRRFKFGDRPDQEVPLTMSFGVVPMEQLLDQTDWNKVIEFINDPNNVRFVTEEQVEHSKSLQNGNGNGGGEKTKIIQPDLIFDPTNPRKCAHDVKLLIAFEYAHALASKVNHAAKEAGRNTVCRAEWNDFDRRWEAKGPRTNEIIDLSDSKFTQFIIQGTKEEYLAAIQEAQHHLS